MSHFKRFKKTLSLPIQYLIHKETVTPDHKFVYKKVLIAAPEVLAIPVVDCREPLVNVRKVNAIKLVYPPETPQKESGYAFVRKGVAERLVAAQERLPEGMWLRLYEGFRSLDVQQQEFDLALADVQRRLPELSTEAAFVEATKLISPVRNLDGTWNIPPHNTGAAVDVEIVEDDGTLLDFGMEIKDWSTVIPSLCETKCEEISREARKNRHLLFEVMTGAGFVNYFTEWWHFSYGDRYWAFLQQQKQAIYGTCHETMLR